MQKCPEKVFIGDPKNNNVTTSKKDIANALNNHFSSIAQNLADKLKKTCTKPSTYLGNANKHSMFLKPVTIDEIIEIKEV